MYMIFDIAPFPPLMFNTAFDEALSQWTDVYGPYIQINFFQNSNVSAVS